MPRAGNAAAGDASGDRAAVFTAAGDAGSGVSLSTHTDLRGERDDASGTRQTREHACARERRARRARLARGTTQRARATQLHVSAARARTHFFSDGLY